MRAFFVTTHDISLVKGQKKATCVAVAHQGGNALCCSRDPVRHLSSSDCPTAALSLPIHPFHAIYLVLFACIASTRRIGLQKVRKSEPEDDNKGRGNQIIYSHFYLFGLKFISAMNFIQGGDLLEVARCFLNPSVHGATATGFLTEFS